MEAPRGEAGVPVFFGKCCESSVGRDGSPSRPGTPHSGGFGETALPSPIKDRQTCCGRGAERNVWRLGVSRT